MPLGITLSRSVCVRVCVCVCANTKITELGRWVVHDKSCAHILLEFKRLNVKVTEIISVKVLQKSL